MIQPLLCTGVSWSKASALSSVSHVAPGNQPQSQGAKVEISYKTNQSPVNKQVTRSQQNRSKLEFTLHHQSSLLRTKHRGGPEPERELGTTSSKRRAGGQSQAGCELGWHPPPSSTPHTTLHSSVTLPWMQGNIFQGVVGALFSAQLFWWYKANSGCLYQIMLRCWHLHLPKVQSSTLGITCFRALSDLNVFSGVAVGFCFF